MSETQRSERGIGGPILYLFAIPAAMTLLGHLDQRLAFTDLFYRALQYWRELTHVFWAWVIGLFSIPWAPTAAQKDGLTFTVLLTGAALSGFMWSALSSSRTETPKFSFHISLSARFLFATCLVMVVVIFTHPYLIYHVRQMSMKSANIYGSIVFLGWVGISAILIYYYCVFKSSSAVLFVPGVHIGMFLFIGVRINSDYYVNLFMVLIFSSGLGFAFFLVSKVNPKALIRIVAVMVGIYLADRAAALIAPMVPALERVITDVEARAQEKSATP